MNSGNGSERTPPPLILYINDLEVEIFAPPRSKFKMPSLVCAVEIFAPLRSKSKMPSLVCAAEIPPRKK